MKISSLKTDFLILFIGFLLFLAAVVFPTCIDYFSYSSDARSTYDNQGFQILDAIHSGELPLWDPYNANGREGSCLSIGMGVFAPDLLFASWLVDKLLPGMRTIDKSYLVNLLFRYFLVFGLGLWFLGKILFRTRTALYFFWFISVFGTPVFLPLNNQMLSQAINYFPWILFFLLKFSITGAFWAVIGFFVSITTIFIAMSRDLPLLLYAIFVAACVTVIVFWNRFFKFRFSFFSKRQWCICIISLVILIFLILSLGELGQLFLSSFHKVRGIGKALVDMPLSEEIDQGQMMTLEFLPDLKSLIFPLPVATPRYGHYSAAHSYLFMGLSGFILIFFSFSRSSRKPRAFFMLLIIFFFLSSYWNGFPFYNFFRKIIPGLKMYQYVFHLKYFILLCLVVLASFGLDNLIGEHLKRKKTIIASTAILCLLSLVLTAWVYPKVVKVTENPQWYGWPDWFPKAKLQVPFLIYGCFLIVVIRCLQGFSLLKLMDHNKIKKRGIILVTSEIFICIFFLFTGRPVFEYSFIPAKTDPMYLLKYRLNNFTLHTADPSGCPYGVYEGACLGTVYKVNLGKDEHLRMKSHADLYRNLAPEQKERLLGVGSPRLFLAQKVRVCTEENLIEILNNSDSSSLLEVPVIVDDGNLPPDLPLLLSGETLTSNSGTISLNRISIPSSSMDVRLLKGKEDWSRITVKGMKFSRHLSSNPYIVMQEHLRCYLNGETLEGNWTKENLEDVLRPSFELNKNSPDILEVVAPVIPDKIESLELEFRDPGGIYINDFGYNYLDITYSATEKKVLVYMDNYAEGWNASIDGKRIPIMRAYGAYKALLVPPGRHKIRFWYNPEKIVRMWKFIFISYLMIIILFVGSFLI